MFNTRCIYLFFFVIYNLQFFSHTPSAQFQYINKFLKKYNRSVTVLEISDTPIEYIFELASINNQICICSLILSNRKADKIVQKVIQKNYKNITILEPKYSLNFIFKKLFQCEHFDVVIIHDSIVKILENKLLKYITKLGDNIIFDIPKKFLSLVTDEAISLGYNVLKSENCSLVHIFCPKKKINWARWSQCYRPPKKNKYKIISTFDRKLLYKKGLKYPTKWKPGINLVTFIMLRGLYPTNKIICDALQKLQKNYSEHNDFVIGNIIVNGSFLELIDFNDRRRNEDSLFCLNNALKLFSIDNSERFLYPEKVIFKYYKHMKH